MPTRRRTVVAVLVLLALTTVGCASTPSADGAPGSTAPAFKITVAGDSISVGLGAALRDTVPAGTVVKVIGEEGTGLARPDRFDWPERLRTLARDFPPQVLVLSLSSNDAQDLVDPRGQVVAPAADRAAWDAEYTRRLAATFDAFERTGTTVVFVAHVRTAEDRVGSANRRVASLAAGAAGTRPWVRIEDLADLLDTGDAVATRCLMPDGLHLTVPCLDEAARALQARLPAPTG